MALCFYSFFCSSTGFLAFVLHWDYIELRTEKKAMSSAKRAHNGNQWSFEVVFDNSCYRKINKKSTFLITDVCSWDFLIWKINFGLWAVGCGLDWTVGKKGLGQLWATFEARFFNFSGSKIFVQIIWKHYTVLTENLHNTLLQIF